MFPSAFRSSFRGSMWLPDIAAAAITSFISFFFFEIRCAWLVLVSTFYATLRLFKRDFVAWPNSVTFAHRDRSGGLDRQHALLKVSNTPTCLAWSPHDSALIAVGDKSGDICVWDYEVCFFLR